MVGLQGKAGMGIAFIIGSEKSLVNISISRVFGIGLFHIENQRGGEAHGQIEDGAKPRRDRLIASFRIDRIEVRREGRDFDGKLDPRDRPEMVPLQQGNGRATRPRLAASW